MTRNLWMLLFSGLFLLPACTRSRTAGEAPRPPRDESVGPRSTAFGGKQQAQSNENSGAADAAEGEKGEKKGLLSRVFTAGQTPPGYAWDGQMSSGTLKMPLSNAQGRAIDTLRNLGFVINTDQTKRQERVATVSAAKADRTSALVTLEEKVAASTEVKVRVGLTGDRGSSERILDEMQKAPAPKATATKKAAPAPAPKTDEKPQPTK